jgi:hypothetical protein
MRSLKLFTVSSILLLCSTLIINGQDAVQYKVKLEKYKAMEHTGNVLLISGSSAIVIGLVAYLIGNVSVTEKNGSGYTTGSRSDGLIYGGGALMGAGFICLIPGVIDKSVGHKKTREYQIRLDNLKANLYSTPKSTGLRITYRF